ncbi:MAG: phosphatase [Cytophagales bacterium]|nr:phosphatase [Cytophagales bacterium]
MNEDIFKSNGGKFIIPPAHLQDRLRYIKAVLFDWDGVFNSGEKGGFPSSFNEVDSMGINMLRFGYYMLLGHIPYTAVVTGETNQAGFKWAGRERFDHVYYQVKNKIDLLPILRTAHGIEPGEVLFVFDDILDLSLAGQAGVRFLVNRKANPLFNAYCIKHGLCDYLTYSSGSDHAIREITEVALDAIGKFDETIEERIRFDGVYKDFLEEKMSKETIYLKAEHRNFVEKDPGKLF